MLLATPDSSVSEKKQNQKSLVFAKSYLFSFREKENQKKTARGLSRTIAERILLAAAWLAGAQLREKNGQRDQIRIQKRNNKNQLLRDFGRFAQLFEFRRHSVQLRTMTKFVIRFETISLLARPVSGGRRVFKPREGAIGYGC